MKLWQVSTNDNQIRFFWFETEKQAKAHAAEWRKEEPLADIEIEPIEFDATRKGIVEAMNHVISLTCFNEG